MKRILAVVFHLCGSRNEARKYKVRIASTAALKHQSKTLILMSFLITLNLNIIALAEETSAGKLASMSIEELREFANRSYYSDDYDDALKAIRVLIDKSHSNIARLDHEGLELYMNDAICELQKNNLGSAKKILERLLKFARLENPGCDNGGLDQPDCLFFLAECFYREGNYERAERLYRESLASYRKVIPPLSTDLSPVLQGLAGCLARKRKYSEVAQLFRELVLINVKETGTESLRTGWSLLNLSNALANLGRNDEAAPLFEKSVYIFRQSNLERLSKQFPDATTQENGTLKSQLRKYVFGNGDRTELANGGSFFAKIMVDVQNLKKPPKRPEDFYNWRLKGAQMLDAPGLVTMDPGVPLRALIVCVHGLGLHHGTYKAFAGQMAHRGFGVVAFDVRGFGAYKQNRGYDHVDLDAAADDLGSVLHLLRRDYPYLTIFLLGESMGGALALHVAAQNTSVIDGLISSVPAGSRFDAKRTDISVAWRFLLAKNKPFNIGKSVVSQATKKESLRKEWLEDPEARMNLSPVELIQFQKFMNQNGKAARKLTRLPVIIFQGYGDKLVRPDATLALYNDIASEDKDLSFVGHSEHLIFEEGQFKPATINSLTGWLTSHLRSSE